MMRWPTCFCMLFDLLIQMFNLFCRGSVDHLVEHQPVIERLLVHLHKVGISLLRRWETL